MSEDILKGLQELQRQLGQLQAVHARAAQAARAVTTGHDDRGAVKVTLDGRGAAELIEPAGDWRTKLGGSAAELGSAIVAADQKAAIAQLAAWSAGLTDGKPAAPAPEPEAPAPHPSPRPLAELAESVLAGVKQPAEPEASLTSTGPVKLTVASGRITAVEIEPRWLSQQENAELKSALNGALSQVRALSQERARQRQGQWDGVFAELLAVIRDPERFA